MDSSEGSKVRRSDLGRGQQQPGESHGLMINQSQVEAIGSESIDGEDAYKLNIVTGSADYDNLYNIAFSIAAKLTQYPMLMPSINRTELNETGKMEKTVWISKKTYLPSEVPEHHELPDDARDHRWS